MSPLCRLPFPGSSRKLILAFDLGTTFSGISYSVLEPGMVPDVRAVTRYPDQEYTGGDVKVPTVVYYNKNGTMKAIGGTVMEPNTRMEAQEKGWFLCERFKLHLMPDGALTPDENGDNLMSPLPPGKKVEDIFADFYRYLYKCSKDYIGQTVPDPKFWSSVEGKVEFILSHPNGWEGQQQESLRLAAVKAGLIPDTTEGQAHLHLVTEGEACFHFCVNDILSKMVIPNVDCVIAMDAGGGTVDITTYVTPNGLTVSETLEIEEVTIPQSLCAGSITVTARAKRALQLHLAETKYEEAIDHIVDQFDKDVKLRFRTNDRPLHLPIANFSVADQDLGITRGQMKLEGFEVEKFFVPSLEAIVEALQTQIHAAKGQGHGVKAVFLVGGFAANEWLFSKLSESLRTLNPKITLCRPQTSVNKATADGAVSSYLDDLISVRVARWTYGIICDWEYEEGNPEHVARKHTAVNRHNGTKCIPNCFETLLAKGTKVHKTKVFKTTLYDDSLQKNELESVNTEILVYRGDLDPPPQWIDQDPDNFHRICEVKADTAGVAQSVTAKRPGKKTRFQLKYDVELLFGLTELAARISWMDKLRKRKRCDAKLIYSGVEEVESDSRVASKRRRIA
ncbi:hypothetical protein L218DRAFT_390595 [Marasmius fiardii PR-910]|nr:hypothetical protein L218DRAFT_390595 [Marasmius fiardii PR-910]